MARMAVGLQRRKIKVSSDWRTRHRRSSANGVRKSGSKGVAMDKAPKDISNDYKKVGRDRVTLAQPLAAVDPFAWHPVEEHCGFARGEEGRDPGSPSQREATTVKNTIKTVPGDAVKSFVEV